MADPVTLAEARAHLRVTSGSEDGIIQNCLDAAQQHVESITGVTLEPQEIVEVLDSASGGALQAWPVQSIVSVTYVDAAGSVQTVGDGDYRFTNTRRPARIAFLDASYRLWGPITVTVEAGYASPAEVPAALRQAILIATAHFYRDREGVEPMPAAVEALCRPHRLVTV